VDRIGAADGAASVTSPLQRASSMLVDRNPGTDLLCGRCHFARPMPKNGPQNDATSPMWPICGTPSVTAARSSTNTKTVVAMPTKNPLRYATALRARPRRDARKVTYAGAAAAPITQTRTTPGTTLINMCITLTQRSLAHIYHLFHITKDMAPVMKINATLGDIELQRHFIALASSGIFMSPLACPVA